MLNIFILFSHVPLDIASKVLLPLIHHGLYNRLNLFDHDGIEASFLFQLWESKIDLLHRLLIQCFGDLFYNETYNVRYGGDFLLFQKVLNLLFDHFLRLECKMVTIQLDFSSVLTILIIKINLTTNERLIKHLAYPYRIPVKKFTILPFTWKSK